MDMFVVVTQEKEVEVAALLKLTQGRNRIMWMKLPAVEVVLAGMGYALVAGDTGLEY